MLAVLTASGSDVVSVPCSILVVLATGCTVMADIHCGILAVQVAGGTDVVIVPCSGNWLHSHD